MEASEEIVSTKRSAGCPAASIAARMEATGLTLPVEVSLWTTQTARIWWVLSARSVASIASGSAPRRQSVSRTMGLRPSRIAISLQGVANQPVRAITTASPGESVLTSAASQAPVPDAGKTITGPLVLKTRLSPVRTDRLRSAKAGPRWSIVGSEIARRTRPGTSVGPGICRK